MQFRFKTRLTAEEYVRQKAWKSVKIYRCPIHPDSDCRFSRHGTYDRVAPEGTKIVRFLCHTENITFSLLPDCFSSRLPGTLADFEAVVGMTETASRNSGRGEAPGMAYETFSPYDLAAAAAAPARVPSGPASLSSVLSAMAGPLPEGIAEPRIQNLEKEVGTSYQSMS